ncbi:hypothetical protein Gotri_027022 [Gossypium trilobum]|uniref:Zinc finger RING-H2-type domain-containing protein n=1 Tax=Gossypium trilobum TaxID=34281 RepID=A0A7J9FV13_9ROSI|nr:hypothetical protein [Gossypium trilobum]
MATLDSDVPMVPAGEASGSSAASSSTKKPKRFEIKKWSAVALWAWDIVVDNCAICRNHIMDLCIECQANQASATSEECTVAWGMFDFGIVEKHFWVTKEVLLKDIVDVVLDCGSATMHFTFIVSADGSRLVKFAHWITVSGSSKSMGTRELSGRYWLNPLTFLVW